MVDVGEIGCSSYSEGNITRRAAGGEAGATEVILMDSSGYLRVSRETRNRIAIDSRVCYKQIGKFCVFQTLFAFCFLNAKVRMSVAPCSILISAAPNRQQVFGTTSTCGGADTRPHTCQGGHIRYLIAQQREDQFIALCFTPLYCTIKMITHYKVTDISLRSVLKRT